MEECIGKLEFAKKAYANANYILIAESVIILSAKKSVLLSLEVSSKYSSINFIRNFFHKDDKNSVLSFSSDKISVGIL